MSALLLALALAQTPACPLGQFVTADTAGHCCWAGQAWSVSRGVCIGVPMCPADMVPSGDACVAAAAPPPPPPPMQEDTACASGAVLMQGVCCWPGQSVKNGACVGSRTCPAGTVLAGNDCVSRPGAGPGPGAGAPPPPPLVESSSTTAGQPPAGTEPAYDPSADRFLHLDRVSSTAVLAADFYTGLYGVQLTLDVSIFRHRYFSVGVGLGAGFLWNWNLTGAGYSNYSLYFPIYAQGGVRLGSSLSEFVVRVGGAPALVNISGYNGWIGKLMVGGGVIFRWSNSGLLVGFDLYLLNRVAHAVTLGFIY